MFIIIDILRTGSRRQELYQQIMICMSIFDVFGSAAYAFTLAPTPKEYYYQGAHGNDATCTAQGFFIQVGSVAGYMNVSLAFYYFLVISKSISESNIQSHHRLCFFACPIAVGLVVAFAGIPYYENLFLWW